MWIVNASTQRPELVQMFEVAFLAPDMLLARRERQHEAALALRVDRLARRRPGICREYFCRVANSPT